MELPSPTFYFKLGCARKMTDKSRAANGETAGVTGRTVCYASSDPVAQTGRAIAAAVERWSRIDLASSTARSHVPFGIAGAQRKTSDTAIACGAEPGASDPKGATAQAVESVAARVERWAGVRLSSNTARDHLASEIEIAQRGEGEDVLATFPEVTGSDTPEPAVLWRRAEWNARQAEFQFGQVRSDSIACPREQESRPCSDDFLPFMRETLDKNVRCYKMKDGDAEYVVEIATRLERADSSAAEFDCASVFVQSCDSRTQTSWGRRPQRESQQSRSFRWIVVDVLSDFDRLAMKDSLIWRFGKFLGVEVNRDAVRFVQIANGVIGIAGVEGTLVLRDISKLHSDDVWSLGPRLRHSDGLWGGTIWWLFVFCAYQRWAIERVAELAAASQQADVKADVAKRVDALFRYVVYLENCWIYNEIARSTTLDEVYRCFGGALDLSRMWEDVQGQVQILLNEQRRQHDLELQTIARTFAVVSIVIAGLIGLLTLSADSSRAIVQVMRDVWNDLTVLIPRGVRFNSLDWTSWHWVTGVTLSICFLSPIFLYTSLRRWPARPRSLMVIAFLVVISFYVACGMLINTIAT